MTKTIRDQILAVRDTGKVNMFDVYGVVRIANKMRLYALANYLIIKGNRKEYATFILTGEADVDGK